MNRMRSASRGAFARVVANAFIAACFVLALAVLVLYLVCFYRAWFNSDDAVLNLLAETMRRRGSLLPNGWTYNNGDLMMPSGTLIVAAALQWLPNGYTAHSIASLFAVVLMLASTLWLLRVLKMPSAVVLFFCVLSVAGFGLNLLILLYSQTTYVWWPAGLMLGIALICRHRLGRGGRAATTLALFLLVFALSFANPHRVALMVVLPLWLFDRVLADASDAVRVRSAGYRRWLRRLGLHDLVTSVGIAGAFLGALVSYELLHHAGIIRSANGAAGLHWAGWAGMLRHLCQFPGDWLGYLAGNRDDSVYGSVIGAALHGFRRVFALWLTWIGVGEVAATRRQADPVRRALAAALIGAFVPVFLIYNACDPLAINAGTIRYFHGPITLLTIQAAFRIRDGYARFERPVLVVLAAASFALSLVAVQRFVPVAAAGTPRFWSPDSARLQLAHALEREGMQWGYATWWNAGATTVLSESKVRVNPVVLGPTAVGPFGYMVASDWYEPDAWVGPSFLALEPKEQGAAELEALNAQFGTPVRAFVAAGYRVLVYDHNLALDFRSAGTVVDAPFASGTVPVRLLSAELVESTNGLPPRGARLWLRNDGGSVVSGFGRYPLLIGVHLLDAHGKVVAPDWRHVELPRPIWPSEERMVEFDLPALKPGAWTLRFDVGQEHVGWFGARGAPTIDRAIAIAAPPDEIFHFDDRTPKVSR